MLPAPEFRIDKFQPTSSQIEFVSGHMGQVDSRLNDFDSERCEQALIDWIMQSHAQIALSHYMPVQKLLPYTPHAWIRKIHPINNVFGCLKNIFYKKQNLDWINYTQTDFVFQFDQIFEGLKDWYFKIKNDKDLPDGLVIDFGKLYNIDYLVELFREANGFEPDSVKLLWAQNYLDKQFPAIHDCEYLDMQQIIDYIQPKDVFDTATVLFIYEKNHRTIDVNRLWSIDSLPGSVTEALEFLINNQQKYKIF